MARPKNSSLPPAESLNGSVDKTKIMALGSKQSSSDKGSSSENASTSQQTPFDADVHGLELMRRGNRMLPTFSFIPHTGVCDENGQAMPAKISGTGKRDTHEKATALTPEKIRLIMLKSEQQELQNKLQKQHTEVFYSYGTYKGSLRPAYMWVALEMDEVTGKRYLPDSIIHKFCPLWRILLAFEGNLKAFDNGEKPTTAAAKESCDTGSNTRDPTPTLRDNQMELATLVKDLIIKDLVSKDLILELKKRDSPSFATEESATSAGEELTDSNDISDEQNIEEDDIEEEEDEVEETNAGTGSQAQIPIRKQTEGNFSSVVPAIEEPADLDKNSAEQSSLEDDLVEETTPIVISTTQISNKKRPRDDAELGSSTHAQDGPARKKTARKGRVEKEKDQENSKA